MPASTFSMMSLTDILGEVRRRYTRDVIGIVCTPKSHRRRRDNIQNTEEPEMTV